MNFYLLREKRKNQERKKELNAIIAKHTPTFFLFSS